MKKITLLFILFLCSQNIFLQANCDITQYYDDFIKITRYEWEGETYLNFTTLDSIETEKCYSEIFTTRYIDYLRFNFFSGRREVFTALNEVKDTESIENMQKILINKLENDANFNNVMMELVDKTVNNKIPKDTITVQFLMNIASKFFKVIGVDAENRYLIKFCVGDHGNGDTEINRNPQVEAFAWGYTANKFGSPEVVKIRTDMRTELNSINLGIGINNEEGILRAQGALYYIMSKNEDYKNFLLAEYQANKDILPFVIVY